MIWAIISVILFFVGMALRPTIGGYFIVFIILEFVCLFYGLYKLKKDAEERKI